jgi:hypothetical protein
MSPAHDCIWPLAKPFRVKLANEPGRSEIWLTSINLAARYLEREFSESSLAWQLAAGALEAAATNPDQIGVATRALEHLLVENDRIVVPHPSVTGQFVAR